MEPRSSQKLNHLPSGIRGKVEADLKGMTSGRGFRFDVANDYQLHLYALHLRLSGKTEQEITDALMGMPLQVSDHKKARYVDDIVHSLIVGFPNNEGELLPVYMEVK
jgi:hypothetical protein